MNRASSPTGWVRNPTMKLPDLDPHLASSYELGWTSNPITGCLNHTPEGLCLGGMFPCYAFTLANGRLKQRYLANDNIANPIATGTRDEIEEEAMEKLSDPFYPRFWHERLYEPVNKERRWGRQSRVIHTQEPKGIFVCDMSDLFGIGIPEEWTRRVLDRFQYCPQHRFYLLTKQPQNLAKFSPFPENCWVGVTATGYFAFNKALDYLKYIEANVKFISIEPLLEAIPFYMERLAYCGINWLIIGAQTKPYKPPQWELVSDIIDNCVDAGIPYFLKNNLNRVVPKVFGGDGELIQEMPIIKKEVTP